MSEKNYKNDYLDPRHINDRFPIEPKETFEIEYIKDAILYRNKLILEGASDLCQVHRIKQEGTRCTNPQCPAFNNYQQAGNPDCNICFGSGWVGGYNYIEEIKVRLAPSNERLELGSDGALRQVKPKSWTMAEPIINTHDVIINMSQPKVLQEEVLVDIEVARREDLHPTFDVLDTNINENRQIIRIMKISNRANSDKDYTENLDYKLSNNGILWVTDNKPELLDSYYVTYSVSQTHYRRYEVNNVTPSRFRGVTLHQDLDLTELDVKHPSYRIGLQDFDDTYVYFPFPISEWYERDSDYE